MNQPSKPSAVQTIGLFVLFSLGAGAFHEILLHGSVSFELSDMGRIIGGGFVTAVISWLIGPFILLRQSSRKLRITGLMLWISLCLLLQAIVVYSMTCCAM
jgi:hypothetical protein